ncbi:MAG: thioredoxin family protein [Bacteroidota bacterium]
MKKNVYLILVIAVAVAIGSAFVSPRAEGYEVGDTAVDFELKNIDGAMVSMGDYDDAKGFLVVFTCNTCPYAKMYEDRIIALDQKYKDKGYPVIAINPNDPVRSPGDSWDEMKTRYADKGMTYPYLYDETQEITSTYGATKTPHVYLLNKESNQLVVKYIGAIDDNFKDASAVTKTYLEDAVDALIDNKAVPTTSTKAIGCTIKWKES